MKIEIHMIQNYSPSNLNRDDLGAPKTCYFGGYLRSRISSQCLKRSIRFSPYFKELLGGIRTRRLVNIIMKRFEHDRDKKQLIKEIMNSLQIKIKGNKDESEMLIFTTNHAINEIVQLLKEDTNNNAKELAPIFANIISKGKFSPDIALCGRMLETGEIKDTTVEAALQVAHAISTHEARPEIDYFVTVDDIKGEDAGAGYIDEALFSSSCFYKYFSIDWEQLIKNLNGNKELAAHTVGSFLFAAAMTNPSGKQNSFAAHNYPDGILVEFKSNPVSYANAFVKPVTPIGETDLVARSIGQLANYIQAIKKGYFPKEEKIPLWFSPNMLYPLRPSKDDLEVTMFDSLSSLVEQVILELGFEWEKVKSVMIQEG